MLGAKLSATLRANMKNILTVLILLFATTAYAGQNIDVCNNCKIFYQTKKVVKTVRIPTPVAVPVAEPVYAPVGVMPMGPGPISSTVPVPVYAPLAPVVQTPVPVVPTYTYVPTPEVPGMPYSPPGYPTEIPVATTRNGCAFYVDPYDLFGQIFGGADLVQSCWTRAW